MDKLLHCFIVIFIGLLGYLFIGLFISPVYAAYTETTYYIHQDHLGSVIAVSDDKGNNVSQTKYSPYGNELTTYNLQPTTEREYTGQIADKNTQLAYYNARYYDPVLSRFISADSVRQLADQLNRYSYVGGNPIMMNDPGGQRADEGIDLQFESYVKDTNESFQLAQKISKKYGVSFAYNVDQEIKEEDINNPDRWPGYKNNPYYRSMWAWRTNEIKSIEKSIERIIYITHNPNILKGLYINRTDIGENYLNNSFEREGEYFPSSVFLDPRTFTLPQWQQEHEFVHEATHYLMLKNFNEESYQEAATKDSVYWENIYGKLAIPPKSNKQKSGPQEDYGSYYIDNSISDYQQDIKESAACQLTGWFMPEIHQGQSWIFSYSGRNDVWRKWVANIGTAEKYNLHYPNLTKLWINTLVTP